MPDEPVASYATELGRRLRAIRQQQGLSLHGVQRKSEGRWKAVVVGSYERGDRSITAQRLAELAAFYGIPVTRLLPGTRSPGGAAPARTGVVIDLEGLRESVSEQTRPLQRFVSAIQDRRGDYNGRVLSIREDDVRSLALLYDETPVRMAEQLNRWGLLDQRGG